MSAEVAMDHAEVREHLESALLSPGKLNRIEEDTTPAGEQLREHLASCAPCRSELRALRETAALLAAAAPDDLQPPAEARGAVLQAIRETGVARPLHATARAGAGRSAAGARARSVSAGFAGRRWPALALAAVVALLLLVAAAISLVGQRDNSEREVRELAAITAATDRVLREPGSERIVLHDQAGKAAGTVVYSRVSHELVVMSDALATPAKGERYDCYVQRSGERRNVGWMHFASGLAYWAGKVESLPDPGDPAAAFVVTRGEEDLLEGEL
jgi:hypothetical protein